MKENCGACKYWHNPALMNGETVGTCHRYPPTPIALANGMGQVTILNQLPQARRAHSCGEFSQKPILVDELTA